MLKLHILRNRPDKGTQTVVIALDQGQLDGLGILPQTVAPGAILRKGMNIGVVPKAGNGIVIAPQYVNALIGTGRTADMKQRIRKRYLLI